MKLEARDVIDDARKRLATQVGDSDYARGYRQSLQELIDELEQRIEFQYQADRIAVEAIKREFCG